MTAIIITYPEGRIDHLKRKELAATLTDAVLVIECGQIIPAARGAFQVHFRQLPLDHLAIGGALLSDQPADILFIDLAVMDGYWPDTDRKEVFKNIYAALCAAFKIDTPSPTWWINFRVIGEGSWGSRGGSLSILDLLGTGAFTAQRAAEIRANLSRSTA